jgi:hypothetical protein
MKKVHIDYTSVEVLRILVTHPGAELAVITSLP